MDRANIDASGASDRRLERAAGRPSPSAPAGVNTLSPPRTPPMLRNSAAPFNFDLGESADMIRESARRFSDKEIAPRAAAIDRENQFPRDLWPKMGELGLHGITAPEEYGGLVWAISNIASRSRRFRAAPPRSGSPMARIPISASIRSCATATPRRKRTISRSSSRANMSARSRCRSRARAPTSSR